MHYLIDGYNLLFQMSWLRESALQTARQKLLLELEGYASKLSIHISIVFDAPFQSDSLSRSHFKSLEIIFTSQGQTADQFLIDWLSHLQAKNYTVITSDRSLAKNARMSGAKVENVATFLAMLKKRLLKKQKRLLEKVESTKAPIQQRFVPPPLKKKPSHGKEELPPLTDLDAWERLFSSELCKAKQP